MLIHVYVHEGRVLIPTLGTDESGIYTEAEPIEVIDPPQEQKVEEAFKRAVARGTPNVEGSGTGGSIPPIVLAAKEISRSSFEGSARLWSVLDRGDTFEIVPTKLSTDGGFEDDEDNKEVLPSTGGIDALAQRVAQLVVSASRS
jgi:hypothetical protein